jgi:glucose/arabinose dehydrogenase
MLLPVSALAQASSAIDRFDNVDGVADLQFDPANLETGGLAVEGAQSHGDIVRMSFDVSEMGSLRLSVSNHGIEELLGDLHMVGRGAVIKSAESLRRDDGHRSLSIRAQRLRMTQGDDGQFILVSVPDDLPIFRLLDLHPSFDRDQLALTLKGAVKLHDGLRKRLRLKSELDGFVGSFSATVRMHKTQTVEMGANGELLQGEMFAQRGAAGSSCNNLGPDVIIGDLSGISNYAALGGIDAFSVGTTSCNIGNTNLLWISGTNEHPVIGQAMFRLKGDRFTQIGQSWLKHGFTALQGSLCEDAEHGCTCVSSGTGSALGVGCSDPYGSSLNGSQSGLGPKAEINAATGFFPYPWVNPGDQGSTGDSTYKRVQVHTSDLDPAVNPGALYFVDGHYIAADDAIAGNDNNNAAYRPCTISGAGDYSASLTGSTQREQQAIRAWKDTDPTVMESDVDIPNDGLVIVSSKAVDLGGGIFRYEYAVQNHNSDRSIGSFTVPASGAVQNIGFHDVAYHSGEPWDGTDWTPTIGAGTITWATDDFATNTNANALRWSTLYNFWFETDEPPVTQVATLGLFKPGTPSSVTAAVSAPASGPVDCNNNGVDDDQDVANGTSQDCNGNFIPDECETLGSCDIAAVPVASGLSAPVFVGAPAGDSRLFIVEQGGRIKVLDGGVVVGTPYLNISGIITSGGERGLLSAAFDPDFDSNARFYVNYTNTAGNTVVARYTASGGNPASNTADAGSAVVLKTIVQDFANHNGGQLQFGPDGMLYVAMGDGGSSDDPNERAQDDGSLLGKMLRLDVNNGPTYIPADNPYVGGGDPLDEIWAKGLRNPWRFSFDRMTGDMYIGDVGQSAREEIDFQPASSTGGENYGWDCREGFVASPAGDDDCSDPPYVDPILDVVYGSSATCSITGGYVYRGCEVPGLQGTYLYADYCGDWVRSFEYEDGDAVPPTWTDRTSDLAQGLSPITSIASFGEDGSGEMYIVSLHPTNGKVYQIVCDDGSGFCGNDVIEAGEECDDGNTGNGDGCDENCDIESGMNDDCADALIITDGDTPYDTTSANTDGSPHAPCQFDDQTYHDIWYDYTATCTGDLTVSTCNQANYDSDLVIYTGCDCGTMTFLDCNDDAGGCSGFSSEMEVAVVGGQCYKVRIGGYQSGDQGIGTLTIACDGVPVPVCGDGNIDPGEECDPPNGTTCDANCMIAFDDCNNNGIDDLDDIANCSNDPACGDCNTNSVPDGCDISSGSSIDCDGGPIGSIAGGDTIINAFCFACHGTDGTGGAGLPGPNLRNKSRVELLFVTTGDHPGGIFNFTPQEFANLEAFLADSGSRGRPDMVPDECQTLSDCDIDTVTDACELDAGTQVDLDYNGQPDDCEAGCTEPCDDGNACTINDACVGNVCVGTTVDCSGAGDACNSASCDFGGTEGNCDILTPVPNGTSCDDGDVCTTVDNCRSGVCGGSAVDCSGSGNDCNAASCDSGEAAANCDIMTPLADGTMCDDTDACTENDSCTAGVCGGAAVDCDDANVCTTDSCDSATGCAYSNNTMSCNDGDGCTENDTCAGGACSGTAVDCDDSNPCTDDSCSAGACVNANNTATCDDSDACTENDVCANGACSGATIDCDDSNPCTDDSCSAGACVNANNTATCDDGDACTENDVCANGACSGDTIDCDDGNPCTDDACNTATGCTTTPNTAACDDGDGCTENDACAGGICLGTPLGCDDDNTCTGDFCVDGECTYLNNSAPCDDNDGCTENDACSGGACSGAAIDCDDSNPCTDDSCSGGVCVNDNNTAACDDDDACTENDACTGGACGGTTMDCDDSNPCTDDSCSGGACVNDNNTAACDDDDACTENDACSGGACGGTIMDCDDSNPCTDDSCSGGACVNANNTAACDDSDACTENDACSGGACSGSTLACDDGNACTNDTCDPIDGCTSTPTTGACDDGNACTENDTCSSGTCLGSPIDCDDGDDCTIDTCDLSLGCIHDCAPQLTPCDFGSGPGSGTCDDNCTCEELVVGSCVDDQIEMCCDIAPQNGVRDDGCEWCDCDNGVCLTISIVFADMGGAFGACPPDGFANVHDRNLALTCFSNQTTCLPLNIDAGGSFGSCAPDGFCNVHDANLALTAFSGTTTCVCPAGPQPEGPAAIVGEAEVALLTDRGRVRQGQRFEVRAFVTADVGLQSYQLHIASSGGRRGSLELIDIDIDPQYDNIFAGRSDSFSAFNVDTGQMLAGVNGKTQPANDAYLATFIFEASPDAAGSFVIELLTNEALGDQTFMIADFTDAISITHNAAAVIEIAPGKVRPRTRR